MHDGDHMPDMAAVSVLTVCAAGVPAACIASGVPETVAQRRYRVVSTIVETVVGL